MPNFPPPAPPPDLLDDSLSQVPSESWRAVALYDFAATHPDDLTLKVILIFAQYLANIIWMIIILT